MKTLLLFGLIIVANSLFAQDLAKFVITSKTDRVDAPVSVPLDAINYNSDRGTLVLYELSATGEEAVPSQVEAGHTARLWFVLEGPTTAGSERRFVIRQEDIPGTIMPAIQLQLDSEDLILHKNDQPVLKYRYGTTLPPKEANPLFKRSGYIHPLWSPGGKVLTRIQPADHYHHYGIWGPWTKTHIDGREVDFWNLIKGEGTVKFASFLSETQGALFSGFEALQQHIDFGAKGEDQVAMNEVLDVRVWNLLSGVWMIDYTVSLNCPLTNGIMLDAYRYGGGIGWRATETWDKDNCTVLTSEGKTRADADGSNARWCIVEGESETEQGRSGILFLSHPSNRMHPEPMRVWPLDANGGRGDMYFEFVPIRHNDWKLDSKTNYTLKYRMIVFDGKLDAATAEKYWNSFASMPEVEFIN